MSLWQTFLFQPLVNLLIFVYQAVGGNLGLAIIVATFLIRLALIPLTLPGMKSAQKMQELKPELDKLKAKHGKDKQALAQAQMQLYKEKNISPMGGILPMIIQFMILIALFQAFNSILKPINGAGVEELNNTLYSFLKLPKETILNTKFLYFDVTKPDTILLPNPISIGPLKLSSVPGALLIITAAAQFFSSKITMALGKGKQKKKTDKKGKEDMASSMQSQMMYLAPLMTFFIGMRFPSGLVLYWLVFSISMILQQVYMKKFAPSKNIKNK
jgi:YidC/Oxa1 family membrane protein insertase